MQVTCAHCGVAHECPNPGNAVVINNAAGQSIPGRLWLTNASPITYSYSFNVGVKP